MLALSSSLCLSAADSAPPKFDAIIVAGGGIDGSGLPLPWVLTRLDAALNRSSETEYFLALSRGTTHEPPPLDMNGFPIDEAQASTNYLVQRGIDRKRILQDTRTTWSVTTNARPRLPKRRTMRSPKRPAM